MNRPLVGGQDTQSTLWCLKEGEFGIVGRLENPQNLISKGVGINGRGLENCLKFNKWGVLKKLLNSATFSVEKTQNE